VLLRPDASDLRVIAHRTGTVLTGVGLAMLIPAGFGFLVGETNDAVGLVIGAALAMLVGRVGILLRTRATLRTSHGLVTVAVSWLSAPVFAAVPLLLSGHYASYLDAYFEAMSGFATIGLTLVNDIDHLSRSINLWRHLMQFIGGQGIIIVVLTIVSSAGGAVGSLYVGEGREERILPNVFRTARFIWRVALGYFLIGTTALWVVLVAGGFDVANGLYHATALFMAAFDTGGFAVQSSSVAFYRSAAVEAVLLVIMIAGACSFAIHYHLWQRRAGAFARHLETRTLALSLVALYTVMSLGLVTAGTFTEPTGLLRHGLFHSVSAHTTTGLTTMPGRLLLTDWGVLAPAMVVMGMGLGGMAGSTAGGIKAIRIGLIAKSVAADIRRVLLPDNAVIVTGYHAGVRRVLTTAQVRGAITVLLLWLACYGLGAGVGLFYGYDLEQALFESTAAASSGGLSVGVVRPDMEWLLKITYIAQMVLGRLEFVAIFAMFGYGVAYLRGRG
jgi:trk system potassium uptake protein